MWCESQRPSGVPLMGGMVVHRGARRSQWVDAEWCFVCEIHSTKLFYRTCKRSLVHFWSLGARGQVNRRKSLKIRWSEVKLAFAPPVNLLVKHGSIQTKLLSLYSIILIILLLYLNIIKNILYKIQKTKETDSTLGTPPEEGDGISRDGWGLAGIVLMAFSVGTSSTQAYWRKSLLWKGLSRI